MTRRRLPRILAVALGGNALSPPCGDLSLAAERRAVERTAAELALVAGPDVRLLVVHGNGPQVGRLLAAPGFGDANALDIHVAQTQGELGYLLVEAIESRLGGARCAALVTRVVVDAADPAFGNPTKPVGAVLAAPPPEVAAAPTADGAGWRRVVASPRPIAVVEERAIAALLATHHVVAGGGGGVPLAGIGGGRQPRPAVVDKDFVAAHLAIAVDAERLLFVTDVPCAYDRFGGPASRPIPTMTVAAARRRLDREVFAEGSMRPKVESAVAFVMATGRPAIVTAIGAVAAGLAGRAGTTIRA